MSLYQAFPGLGPEPSVSRRLRTGPEHDPLDPVESAVINRLAGNWTRRAAAKQREPDLDDLFEPDRPDYPDAMLPFRDHPTFCALDDETKARLRAWAWVAFNKIVMDIEQHVVNPGFGMLADDVFDTGLDESMIIAVTQAMVDEQYHTLMHLNASAVTRRRRGWRMPESALPLAHKARQYKSRIVTGANFEQRALATLAYTTVAEISINAYLDLVANDTEIQPINRMTATLHNRDEYCHASIAEQIAKAAYARFTPDQRHTFLAELVEGLEAFAANDFATWYRIIDIVDVPGGAEMLRDIESEPDRRRLLQDFSGLYELCRDMEVLDALPFDWSTVSTAPAGAGQQQPSTGRL